MVAVKDTKALHTKFETANTLLKKPEMIAWKLKERFGGYASRGSEVARHGRVALFFKIFRD
ncbi:hypothetical protein AAF712_008531 [Marasmius tenuissimus]|uniref:Uncharacterized protein n=1 Tax=Marasmius tenuissimus TaxID=585030 RepID=A0ABR2ZSM5_9AGAR